MYIIIIELVDYNIISSYVHYIIHYKNLMTDKAIPIKFFVSQTNESWKQTQVVDMKIKIN